MSSDKGVKSCRFGKQQEERSSDGSCLNHGGLGVLLNATFENSLFAVGVVLVARESEILWLGSSHIPANSAIEVKLMGIGFAMARASDASWDNLDIVRKKHYHRCTVSSFNNIVVKRVVVLKE